MQALKLANIPEITFVDLYADDFRRENSNMGCSNKFRNPDDRKSQIIMRNQKTRQIELRTTLQSYNMNNVSRFFSRFEENFALLLSGTWCLLFKPFLWLLVLLLVILILRNRPPETSKSAW